MTKDSEFIDINYSLYVKKSRIHSGIEILEGEPNRIHRMSIHCQIEDAEIYLLDGSWLPECDIHIEILSKIDGSHSAKTNPNIGYIAQRQLSNDRIILEGEIYWPDNELPLFIDHQKQTYGNITLSNLPVGLGCQFSYSENDSSLRGTYTHALNLNNIEDKILISGIEFSSSSSYLGAK